LAARLKALRAALTEAESATLDAQARANYYRDTVIPAMEALRESADGLEVLVAKDLWPLPSYGDILFSVR
jgi:glutamine synthetase